MELNNIEQLLEQYFDGNTTLEQEKQLINYFSSANVAPQLQQYKPLFDFYSNEQKAISKKETVLKSNNNFAWMAMAASIVLLVGIASFYLFKNPKSKLEEGFGTYENPETAFLETQKALQMISTNVNIGIKSVAYINEYHKTKSKVFIE
jgi:uncharacterized protein HemX